MLYQLGKYNTKEDLSFQAKLVRDHILLNWDFESNLKLLNQFQDLEHETIVILQKAINAGYWDSYYGLNWSKENELEFWQIVYSKSSQLTISKLQFVRTLQSSGRKAAIELIDKYITILESSPSHRLR